MLGQLTEHLQRRTVTIATAGCAVALFFSVLSLAGPVGKAQAIWYENDQVTVDGDAPGVLVTIKAEETGLLMAAWPSPLCDKDFTGDGTSGSGGDRATCVLDLIYQNCGKGFWPTVIEETTGVRCVSVTWPPAEMDDINGALHDVSAGKECLAVHVGSNESGPYNWTSRDISEDECS